MPGKQRAIDADLSAGLIDETQARTRRKELEAESQFFGSMDGSAKFVRGDAIAGLLITFIKVLGGIIIGTAQMELSLSDAAATTSEAHTSERQSRMSISSAVFCFNIHTNINRTCDRN